MDQARKAALAAELRALAAEGIAIVLATHDAELAVAVAARTVLLGKGEVVADAPTAERARRRLVLRDPDRAHPRRRRAGSASPAPQLLRAARRRAMEVARELDRRLDARPRASRSPPASPGGSAATRRRACSPSSRRSPRWRRSAGSPSRRSRTSSRRPTSSCSRLRARRGARASWSARSPRSPPTCSSARARGRRGRWSPGARVGLFGAALAVRGAAARRAGSRSRSPAGSPATASGRCMNVSLWVTYGGDHTLAKLLAYRRHEPALRRSRT